MKYEELKKLIAQGGDPAYHPVKHEPFMEGLLDYESICSRIFYRLIPGKGNERLLEKSPYISFFDMAITFRWLFHEDENGISSALIEKKHLELWDIDEEELIRRAIYNTPELFPSKMCRILEMLNQWVDLSGPDLPLYVLTNRVGINGASVIFYKDVLAQFGEKISQSFYIMPSSIHEVLLIAEGEVRDSQDLYDMVREANHTVVTAKDFLSDQVLYYNLFTQEIEIAHQRK